MVYDAEFMKAVEDIKANPPAGVGVASTQDLCSVYTKIKPILQGILPFLSLIPKIGAQAAAAIKSLMAGLDVLCGHAAALAPNASATRSGFETALAKFEVRPATAAMSLTDICAIYRDVRPILEAILPFLRLIPSIGDGVAAAITALVAVLDRLCPAK